jgi:DivIVA domain-containing protein
VTITPADVEAQTFPIVFRGYKVEAVDAFLDRLRDDLGRMLPDPASTAATAAASTDRAAGFPDQAARLVDPPVGPGTDTAARAVRTLARAEEMAEQMLAEAVAEAEGIRARAHGEAEEIVGAARVESGRVESELQARRQRELGALVMQAQQLRAEIDRLGGLERRYRDGLQELLAQQQRLLEQRIPVPDAAMNAEVAEVADADDAVQPAA